jgi:hypothetical protein
MLKRSQEYTLAFRSNFITLSQISEEEKIEIIQTRNEVPFFRFPTSKSEGNFIEEIL